MTHLWHGYLINLCSQEQKRWDFWWLKLPPTGGIAKPQFTQVSEWKSFPQPRAGTQRSQTCPLSHTRSDCHSTRLLPMLAEVTGSPPPHCMTHRSHGTSSTSLCALGKANAQNEQESPARRRWMELHPWWDLGFPLPTCYFLFPDCSGDAAGKLLAPLLQICWLPSELPCKVPSCLQRK